MKIAMPRTIMTPTTELLIHEEDIISIIDVDTAIISEVNYAEAVHLCSEEEVIGLRYNNVTLHYNSGRIMEALNGNFALELNNSMLGVIRMFEHDLLAVTIYNNSVFFEVAQEDGLGASVCRLEFDSSIKFSIIKDISCAWIEKIGDYYRALVEVRVTIEDRITRVPRIHMFLLFNEENWVVENIFYSDTARGVVKLFYNSVLVGSKSHLKTVIAKLKLVKPIATEFELGFNNTGFSEL